MIAGEMDHPVVAETYTVTEAAEALGLGVNTLRRWVAADKFPAAILEAVGTAYKVYSRGELEAAGRALRQHTQSFAYLSTNDQHAIEALHQAVHGYRAQYV